MELETGIVVHANGSARLRLANSDILATVKAEIDVPLPNRPNEGKLEFFIDCSANATPQFEGRGGEELAMDIANTLQRTFLSPNAFDLKSLCILSRQQCWKLYIDILILECGGNLYDAVSIAVKSAMFNLKLPRVSAALMDGGSVDLILSDDIHDCDRLDVTALPLLVTLCKIGEHCVIDPSAEEEECSVVSLVVGVSCRGGDNEEGVVTNMRTCGAGSLRTETLNQGIDLSVSAAICLNRELMNILQKDEEKDDSEKVGFLLR